ncbi:c-di-AMP phosphodiesterase-like protein [Flavobacterium arsenatis]|uniref:C-di-AMP phosphodiesterase-like protein n=1 Tax=Flavobacterium arsenatis TaxID=1484332 RepID=A0ABU1TJZ8_9FLAO|nr:c-di-AMP phosphodiesterase-like protein [Flavobacterium arsenatis]
MKRLKPLHLYLIFIIVMIVARFFENKLPVLYYILVVIGFVFFFLALKKYFKK